MNPNARRRCFSGDEKLIACLSGTTFYNIHKGDTLDEWHMESVIVTTVFDESYDVDFCLTAIEELGVITIHDNQIDAKTPLKYSSFYQSPIEKVISFDSLCSFFTT